MADRYADHRRRLGEVVGSEGLAVVPAGREVIRSRDVHYDFHQDTAFWYLTGFPEPDAVALIAPGHDEGEYALFVRSRDPAQELWTGVRAGVEGARADYGADAAYELSDLDEVLQRYMIGREVIWYAPGFSSFDERITSLLEKARTVRDKQGHTVPSAVKDVSVPLGELMLIKDEAEVDSLRRACQLSAEGHLEAMRFAQPAMYEYQIQAALEYYWRLSGSRHNGYPSIVAAGHNACILHYVDNDSRIGESDLVLIDAAAEIDGYSSDITRTFPASGVFTATQRAMYEVVLEAEKKGMEMAAPGTTMGDIHETAIRILTEGMVDLGLLPGPVDDRIAMAHYREFYMHNTGHWLGLDVHDRGVQRINGEHRPLEPGMTFTVEPGLYAALDKEEIELSLVEIDLDQRAERRLRLGSKAAAAKDAEELEQAEKITHRVPTEFLGIGIRIEDDVLITSAGHENMTARVPVEIGDVEAICAEEARLPAGQSL
jgi:Xaa-Pro aminopeptidase